MTRVLFEHFPGCTPTNPCLSCEVATYLRSTLKPEQYNHVRQMILPSAVAEEDKIPLTASVEDLHLSFRTRNALKNDRIRTIYELIRKSPEELLRMPNFGEKSLAELEETLAKHGRRIGEPINATLADFYPGQSYDSSSVP